MLKTNILNKHEVKWSKSPFCWMTLRSSDNHKTTAPLWLVNSWVSRYWLFVFLLVQDKGWYFSEIFSQHFFAKKTESIPSSVSNKWERIEVWCSIKFSQHLRISLWVNILIFYFYLFYFNDNIETIIKFCFLWDGWNWIRFDGSVNEEKIQYMFEIYLGKWYKMNIFSESSPPLPSKT